jgi:acyl-CoA thioesterase-2
MPTQDVTTAPLLDLFALECVEADHYLGQSLDLGFRNLFGGHILGQSLRAAGMTCENRSAHSLHAYFSRAGDAREPIHYHVERVRDGKSFSVRRVVASQGGQAILVLSSSFQIDEPGFEHQATMPEVPGPEKLEAVKEVLGRSIEMRPVDKLDLRNPPIRPPEQYVWFRAVGVVPDDKALHQSLLAYASDFGLLGACMRPHGVSYYQPGMVIASLDHAMWFYQDFRMDEWLLYATDSPSASHSRGLGRGNIFRRDGTLVACVAQEGLIRKTIPKDAT